MTYLCCLGFPGYLSCYLVQPAPGIEYKAEDESPIDCYVKVCFIPLVYTEQQDNIMNRKKTFSIILLKQISRYTVFIIKMLRMLFQVMVVYLRSGSALQRLVGSLVVSSWARHSRDLHMYPPALTVPNGDSGTKVLLLIYDFYAFSLLLRRGLHQLRGIRMLLVIECEKNTGFAIKHQVHYQ